MSSIQLDQQLAQATMLTPSSILVIGAADSPRVQQSVGSLRRGCDPSRVTHIDSTQGTDAVCTRLEKFPDSQSFDCVLLYDTLPSDAVTLVPYLDHLRCNLIVLAGESTDGIDDLLTAAQPMGIRLLGPNGYGPFIGASALHINPTRADTSSGLGVAAQSGNVILDVNASLDRSGGFTPHFAWGLGRSSDVDLADVTASAAADEACTAIAIHAEGFSGGRRLLQAVAVAARKKPVVLLQGGTSKAGSASALSHTGSLSTSRAIVKGLFRQAGAYVVERVDDFALIGLAMSMVQNATAESIAVVADGGGQATLMTDALDRAGAIPAELPNETKQRLSAHLPDGVHIANPLDIGVSAVHDPAAAFDVIDTLLDAPDLDCIITVGVTGSYAVHFDSPDLESVEDHAARAVAAKAKQLGKTLLFVTSYASRRPAALRSLQLAGIPVLDSIDDAATIVGAMRERASFLREVDFRSEYLDDHTTPDEDRLPQSEAIDRVLDEAASRQVLTACGVDLGPFAVTHSVEEAARAMTAGPAYVLKVVSGDISHKSDVGGVRLRVTRDNLEDEYGTLLTDVAARAPGAHVDALSVAPMAAPGVEIIVGTYRDPQFGACIAVGSGGVLAELTRDAEIRSAPVSHTEALEMIYQIRSIDLLHGYRGTAPADISGLANLIVQISQVAATHPEIREIDLNPVIVSPESAQVADARVVYRPAQSDGSRPRR